MRKIEQQMLEAIKSRKSWQSGNTSVSAPLANDWQIVSLHGHIIAACRYGEHGLESQADKLTFKAWPTATTRSRLCALGIRANIIKGKAAINGVIL